MNSIETIILDLLENSSLPGIYKLLIKNLLEKMSEDQKEQLLKILFADQNNIKEVERQKMAIYRKYAPMIDSILESAESGNGDLSPMVLSFIKESQEKKKTETTSLKLDTLKNILTTK